MTRAGRIMGAMMAMTAGLGDYGGGSPNRERYDQWCKRRGFGWSSMTRIERAKAKRARKAAKRRRDAALTALGQQASEARVVSNALAWRMSGPLGDAFHLADEYEDDCRMTMRQIRRGEVQP